MYIAQSVSCQKSYDFISCVRIRYKLTSALWILFVLQNSVVNIFCRNANPEGEVVSETGAGSDIHGCSEVMRYNWCVRSCYVSSSINGCNTIHVSSTSSDQNVQKMSERLELGYVKSKQVSGSGGDCISITGDTSASCDLAVTMLLHSDHG